MVDFHRQYSPDDSESDSDSDASSFILDENSCLLSVGDSQRFITSASQGDLSDLETLIADLNASEEELRAEVFCTDVGSQAFYVAIRNRHPAVMQYLFQQGARMELTDEDDNTAFYQAIKEADLEQARGLLKQRDDNIAFDLAVQEGDLDVIQSFIQKDNTYQLSR